MTRLTIIKVLSLAWILMMMPACNKGNSDPKERPRDDEWVEDSLNTLPDGSPATLISIDANIEHQTIDNFGASDCWSGQFIGKWPDTKIAAMADWLFSKDTNNYGQPLGIGLSAWRFNIGAGSSEQGSESGISDSWRRNECFMDANGNYHWDKQQGQLNLLMAAAERGVEQFIGFANSPPVHFTKNGKAYGSEAAIENLDEEQFSDFADFLVEVIGGINSQTGVELAYVSPVNEPQWEWTSGSQEGCYYTNSHFLGLLEILTNKVTQSGLNTKVLITEAAEWSFLYGHGNTNGNQIELFFGPNSPISNSSSIAHTIAGHSYYSTTPYSTLIGHRKNVWIKASTIDNLKVWSTEYCPLGYGDLQELGWSSWHRDLGMTVALYVSKIIHSDLVYANASAWHWWLGISPYNYPDGLIYVSKSTSNGTYTDSRLMWALGNYSRFIRPGAIRISTEYDNENLTVTAYTHELMQECIFVIANHSSEKQAVKLNLSGITGGQLRPYITSAKENHKLFPMNSLSSTRIFEVPPLSVVTFRLKH